MDRGIITISEMGAVTMPTAPVWMTQFEIADLFGVFSCDVRKAIHSIYKNQQTPASLNINDGTVSYNPAGAGITFTGSYAISADPGTTATIYPMVKSGATNVVMDIVAGGVTYPNVTVNLNTETGKAHNIILTFTPKGIIVSAIVTPWVTGGTGASVVQ